MTRYRSFAATAALAGSLAAAHLQPESTEAPMDDDKPEKRLSLADATTFARQLCLAHGTSYAVATALATATVSAQAHGQHEVGFGHLPDYLSGFATGRIATAAEPIVTQVAPAMIRCDAARGIAQLGFDRAFPALCSNAHQLGIALFAQFNAFTCGELGYYTRRLAREGLVALAFTNGSPLLTVAGQSRPLYSTNPIAFAAASDTGRLLAIDQASSATAYVNLLRAAEAGEAIPTGWAVDAQGNETRSAREALHGTLLAFGGGRGANIALMVEVLAAGVTGANWSLDAGDFRAGSESPGAGMLVVGIAPRLLVECFASRLDEQMNRLEALGVYLPGKGKEQAYARAVREGISLPLAAYDAFRGRVG